MLYDNNSKEKKFALCVEYYGCYYHGWQRQKQKISVQEKLEIAISIVANHPVNIFCAGRTDEGVHSTGQIIHFTTTVYRKDYSWISGINSNLPKDISIIWIKRVPLNFHARYSATSRKYRYIIYNHPFRTSIFMNLTSHVFYNLDINYMKTAGKYLIGEHDFSGFRAKKCQSKTTFRNVMQLNIFKKNFFVIIEIEANAFLYRMVRNIVGSLIEVGLKKKNILWIYNILLSKDRRLAGPTAPAKGLYLINVNYPDYFNLPRY